MVVPPTARELIEAAKPSGSEWLVEQLVDDLARSALRDRAEASFALALEALEKSDRGPEGGCVVGNLAPVAGCCTGCTVRLALMAMNGAAMDGRSET